MDENGTFGEILRRACIAGGCNRSPQGPGGFSLSVSCATRSAVAMHLYAMQTDVGGVVYVSGS